MKKNFDCLRVLALRVLAKFKNIFENAKAAAASLFSLSFLKRERENEEKMDPEKEPEKKKNDFFELREDEFFSTIKYPEMEIDWIPIGETGKYTSSLIKFFEETNARKGQKHIIDKFDIPRVGGPRNGAWKERTRILVWSGGEYYIAKVTYKENKDGSPVVTRIKTKEWALQTRKKEPKLSYEQLLKGVTETLTHPDVIKYCEMTCNTLNAWGEAVFNAPLTLGLSEEEFNEQYGTKELKKAWVQAISERFGGELEPAEVEDQGNGLYLIRY